VAAGESILVIGCGGVGLNVVQGAKLAGARTIIACDMLDNKLAYAKTFGATHTINAKLGDVVKQVQALTDGLGVDAAFDAIGGEATALQALDAVAPGGRTVLVGIPASAVRAPISPSNMVWAEKTISGTYYGSVRPDIDFPILADLDMDKRLNLDDLISRTYKFEEINEGFRLLVSGSVAARRDRVRLMWDANTRTRQSLAHRVALRRITGSHLTLRWCIPAGHARTRLRRGARLRDGVAVRRRQVRAIFGGCGEIEVLARRDVSCERLMSVPEIGPIISSAMVGRVTTSGAARSRHVDPDPRREKSFCRYRYRSRRFQN
jgi:Zinc-binding dehydrogenase